MPVDTRRRSHVRNSSEVGVYHVLFAFLIPNILIAVPFQKRTGCAPVRIWTVSGSSCHTPPDLFFRKSLPAAALFSCTIFAGRLLRPSGGRSAIAGNANTMWGGRTDSHVAQLLRPTSVFVCFFVRTNSYLCRPRMAGGVASMLTPSARKPSGSAKEGAYKMTQSSAANKTFTSGTRDQWLEDGCVDQRRVRLLTAEVKTPEKDDGKCVVCYLHRDLRVQDNWALLFARDVAAGLRLPLHVVHLLVPALGFQPTPRHLRFFHGGAREVQRELASLNIGFHVPVVSSSSANQKLKEARTKIEAIQATLQPAAVICDFFPLRLATQIVNVLKEVCEEEGVPLYQVDSHSVVPTWFASNRLEVAARTLRPRLHSLLKDFSTPFPVLSKHAFLPLFSRSPRGAASSSSSPSSAAAASSNRSSPSSLHELPSEERLRELLHAEGPSPVELWTPGTQAGLQELQRFCCPRRLGEYEKSRNDPLAEAQSNLSPYLHFGQLSQQRCLQEVLLVKKMRVGTNEIDSSITSTNTRRMNTHERDSDTHKPTKTTRSDNAQGVKTPTGRRLDEKTVRHRRSGSNAARSTPSEVSTSGVSRKDVIAGVDAFVEEAIVRCALSENFVFYCGDNYDKLEGAPRWAQESLLLHKKDPRVPLYGLPVLEAADTYDALWNAAQLQVMRTGKMHGYLRMYWAKKMLEWMNSPAEALAGAIYLNDKYSLDGTDPNGYVGCLWSIAALHDQPFKERPIFGKVRYMNYAGCQRKFNVNAFLQLFTGSNSSTADATQGRRRKGGNTARRDRSSSSRVGRGDPLGREATKAEEGAEKVGKALLMTVAEEERQGRGGVAAGDQGLAVREKEIKAQQKRATSGKRERVNNSEKVGKRRPQKVQKELPRESEKKPKQDVKGEKTGKTHRPTKRTRMEQEMGRKSTEK